MTKSQQLQVISDQIKECQICKIDKIGVAVPGEGNPDAEIVLVGEAPGKQEAQTGLPFIGRSGKFLHRQLESIGITKRNLFITSSVKYLPKRGTPTSPEIDHGKIHLLQQISVIQPKVVVLLGNVACQAVLGEKISVQKRHGEIVEKDVFSCFITVHPAAAIRFTTFRNIFMNDFILLQNFLRDKKLLEFKK